MLATAGVDKVLRPLPPNSHVAAQDSARDILRYFLRNPQASDSLEGVVKWRLVEEDVHRTVQATRCALQLLVDKGYLLEHRSAVAGESFALNLQKRHEAERFANEEKLGRVRKESE